MSKKREIKEIIFGKTKNISQEEYFDNLQKQIEELQKENEETNKKIMSTFEKTFETSQSLVKKYVENSKKLHELYVTKQNFNLNYSHIVI